MPRLRGELRRSSARRWVGASIDRVRKRLGDATTRSTVKTMVVRGNMIACIAEETFLRYHKDNVKSISCVSHVLEVLTGSLTTRDRHICFAAIQHYEGSDMHSYRPEDDEFNSTHH